MSDIQSPIVVMSFNRPDLLSSVLESLNAQVGVDINQRNVFLFQDGAVNRYSRLRYSSEELIAQSIASFYHHFPEGTVFSAGENIGVCENFFRAEHYVFETLKAECAYFFEDDLLLAPRYLQNMERLRDFAVQTGDVAYFSCYGDYSKNLQDRMDRGEEYCNLDHHWGFGLIGSKWKMLQKELRAYYKIAMGSDYNRRNHQKVFDLYECSDISPSASSQDAAKAIACSRLSLLRLNTVQPYAKYIGTRGLHMNEEKYERLGYGGIVPSLSSIAADKLPGQSERQRLILSQHATFRDIRRRQWADLRQTHNSSRLSPVRLCTALDVVDVYQMFLSRSPDSPAVFDELVNRLTVTALVRRIVGSQEYLDLGGRPSGTQADVGNVTALYRILLHRDPDRAGLEARVSGNHDIRHVARTILASAEYKNFNQNLVI